MKLYDDSRFDAAVEVTISLKRLDKLGMVHTCSRTIILPKSSKVYTLAEVSSVLTRNLYEELQLGYKDLEARIEALILSNPTDFTP